MPEASCFHPSHESCLCHSPTDGGFGRRRFLRAAGIAAAGLACAPLAFRRATASGGTEALVLSCMDFRLIDSVNHYLTDRGLDHQYDYVILAGASLGAQTEQFPAWNETFWQHLKVSKELHHIQKVVVIDHRDCGAYKLILGPSHLETPEAEFDAHATQLRALRGKVQERYPDLGMDTVLMALDGTVEDVS